jgi:hypothetical protein
MSWQWWCACLGLILVAVGAALAFIGFRKTWSDFVVNEKFWRTLTNWLPRWWGKARKAFVAAYNRLIRRRRFVTSGDHVTAVDASAPVGWNVLPPEFPADEELLETVRRLWERQSDLGRQLGDYIRQANQSFSTVHEDLGKRVTVVDEKVVRVAVGGLSLQAWGLILVTGGTALSSAPALAQVSSPHAPALPHAPAASHAVGHTVVQAAGSLWATDVPGWITAIGTALLAIFAILTTIYAVRAFRKQSQEVSDGRELIGQQKDMLQVQSDRLEVYRGQVDEQREMNAKYREALDLQAREIRASLEQRERAGEEERRSQAAQVTAWFDQTPGKTWAGHIRNASDLPIFDVRTFFHYVAEKWHGGDWDPQMLGGPVEKIRVLPPQQDRFVPIPENVWSQMTDVSVNSHVVSIEFTDAAGNHWERDPRGALVPRS